MSIGSFFRSLFGAIGDVVVGAFKHASSNGLTDSIIQIAIGYAKQAATLFTDNAARQKWVSDALVAKGVPRSIANLAVELAVQAIKAEAAKH